MAITATHAALFRSLPLPRCGSLLEIGEANWYGDAEPDFPCSDSPDLHDVAKAFYAATFAPFRIDSIDMHGTPQAKRYDLNEPTPIASDVIWDVVINHGTAEHIFNIAQVFRTMHDFCAVNGLMVHDAPFTGWIDHGFYSLHPTLFFDLARANNYEVVKVAIHVFQTQQIIEVNGRDSVPRLDVPNNSMLFVCLRKLYDKPFRVPMQGYYAGALSAAGNRAWEDRR